MYQVITLILVLSISFKVMAQPDVMQVPFQLANGTPLQHALTGGLNNPQFSDVDLDGDGTMDLVYFDRQGGAIVPFINNGTPGTVDYQYAPAYQYHFPAFEKFLLLRDYNCDNIQDIFAYNYDFNTGKVGITVWRGSRDPQNKIQFTEVKRIIHFHLKNQSNFFNLFVSSADLPAVDDIDGDGDLDILNFNSAGGYIEYFRNESQELGWGCDSLQYVLSDDCWGRMYESGTTEFIDLSPRIDSCAGRNNWFPIEGPRHAGSTLTTLDADGDGDKDLLLGDLSFKNINLLTNGGTTTAAHLTNQEIFFPQNSTIINIDVFPAIFYVDVNNDNKKDLIAAPNINNNATDKQAWYYLNNSSGTLQTFSYQQNNFLVGEMVDVGTGAFPTFADINGDGLKDLIIGNENEFINISTQRCALHYYENIGSTSLPSFRLTDSNFAGLATYGFSRIIPTFGDLDDDGDLDLIIGDGDGKLHLLTNHGNSTAPNYSSIWPNYASIDVGQNAAPQLVDTDRDGDLDILIGERNGNVNYYENTGSSTIPAFSSTATTETFGWIDARLPGQIEGNAAPQLIDINGTYQYFLGNESGQVWQYTNVENNLTGTFLRVNGTLDSIDTGEESVLSFADIDGDGNSEFVVGNRRGGITIFNETILVSTKKNQGDNDLITIYPNPAHTHLNIDISSLVLNEATIEIYDILGRLKKTQNIDTFHSEINIRNLPAGNYLLHLKSGQKYYNKIFIKK